MHFVVSMMEPTDDVSFPEVVIKNGSCKQAMEAVTSTLPVVRYMVVELHSATDVPLEAEGGVPGCSEEKVSSLETGCRRLTRLLTRR